MVIYSFSAHQIQIRSKSSLQSVDIYKSVLNKVSYVFKTGKNKKSELLASKKYMFSVKLNISLKTIVIFEVRVCTWFVHHHYHPFLEKESSM